MGGVGVPCNDMRSSYTKPTRVRRRASSAAFSTSPALVFCTAFFFVFAMARSVAFLGVDKASSQFARVRSVAAGDGVAWGREALEPGDAQRQISRDIFLSRGPILMNIF